MTLASRSLLWPTILALAGVLVLIGLGTWQLERRAWKAGVIAAREAGLAAPAMPLPAVISDPAALEYRAVTVTGRFRHEREMPLLSRFHRDKPGVQIVTPLETADGLVVLVNRGWVPLANQDPATRAAGQVTGIVTVAGVVRLSVRPGWFTPDNDPARNIWFYPDIAQMAAAAGLTRVAPVFVEAGPAANPGGLPIGGQTQAALPNDHLQYALTWYSLAVVLVVMYGAFRHRTLNSGRTR